MGSINKIIASLIILLFIVFCIIMAGMMYGDFQKIILDENKRELAGQLGVDMDNYCIEGFPNNYYSQELTPGMTIDEVHQVVMYYVKVYACGNNEEVYYYFSDDDMKAYRFAILYDHDSLITFSKIIGEDSDSRSINIDDCEEGLLSIK